MSIIHVLVGGTNAAVNTVGASKRNGACRASVANTTGNPVALGWTVVGTNGGKVKRTERKN